MSTAIPLTVLPAEEQLAFLRQEVARLEEALDAMSGDLLDARAKLEAKHLDWLCAETARREAVEQREQAEHFHSRVRTEADVLRARIHSRDADLANAEIERRRLRAALVAVGRILPACGCGVPKACQRCAILRQRAEALGQVPSGEDPTAAG
jgi:chromosome segregation ATPase